MVEKSVRIIEHKKLIQGRYKVKRKGNQIRPRVQGINNKDHFSTPFCEITLCVMSPLPPRAGCSCPAHDFVDNSCPNRNHSCNHLVLGGLGHGVEGRAVLEPLDLTLVEGVRKLDLV